MKIWKNKVVKTQNFVLRIWMMDYAIELLSRTRKFVSMIVAGCEFRIK